MLMMMVLMMIIFAVVKFSQRAARHTREQNRVAVIARIPISNK